jgi:WD40 repeat protein
MEEEFRLKYGGKTLLSVSVDGVINHWNALTGKLQHTERLEGNPLFTCDFSCDGLKYTVAGKDMGIYLYDELTRQPITTMKSNGLKL